MHTPSLCDIIAAIRPVCAKRGVGKMYLFGSRARGDDAENSDYDFFVSDLGEIRRLSQFSGLCVDLQECLRQKVDLYSDSLMQDAVLWNQVRKDMVRVYQKSEDCAMDDYMNKLDSIACAADMVVDGYAFTPAADKKYTEVINLDDFSKTAYLTAQGEVLETTMDDQELALMLKYYKRNLSFMSNVQPDEAKPEVRRNHDLGRS